MQLAFIIPATCHTCSFNGGTGGQNPDCMAGRPYAYGVHAEPVAKVLREQYGLNALGVKEFTLQQLKAEIAANRPVIAWVIGNCVEGVPYEYTDSQGNTTTVAAYEHVVIVTGYTNETIRYMNNGKFYDIPIQYFMNSWNVLGNMVVYLQSD
ncbi:MAG: C39 family peptidase [Anaerolineaceae bacterium]